MASAIANPRRGTKLSHPVGLAFGFHRAFGFFVFLVFFVFFVFLFSGFFFFTAFAAATEGPALRAEMDDSNFF